MYDNNDRELANLVVNALENSIKEDEEKVKIKNKCVCPPKFYTTKKMKKRKNMSRMIQTNGYGKCPVHFI